MLHWTLLIDGVLLWNFQNLGPMLQCLNFTINLQLICPPPGKKSFQFIPNVQVPQGSLLHPLKHPTQKIDYNGTWKRMMLESACFSRVPFSPGVIVLPTQTKHHMGNHPKLPSLCIVWSPPNGKFNNPCSSPPFGAAMVSNIKTRAKKKPNQKIAGKIFTNTRPPMIFKHFKRSLFFGSVNKKVPENNLRIPKNSKKNKHHLQNGMLPLSPTKTWKWKITLIQKGKLILEGHMFHVQWLLRIRFTFWAHPRGTSHFFRFSSEGTRGDVLVLQLAINWEQLRVEAKERKSENRSI